MSILLRVTQLNAVYLDEEIFKALDRLLQNLISNLSPGLLSPYNKELTLLLKLAELHCSVVRSGSTFGQQLLSIKYEGISQWKKILYLMLNSIGYVKERIELWQSTHEINDFLRSVYFIISVLDFINFTLFLCQGTKPCLIERILGLHQVYTDGSKQRVFGSKYFARELLWNSMIEILANLVPLINFNKLRRLIKQHIPFKQDRIISNEKPVMKLGIQCPCCDKSPVLPHHMGCSHVFCYYCLMANLAADSKFACIKCDHWNENVICESLVF